MPRETIDPTNFFRTASLTLMMTIANGIFSHNLEWNHIFFVIGFDCGFNFHRQRTEKASNKRLALPALAVGMGIYLPPSVNAPIVVGALLAG